MQHYLGERPSKRMAFNDFFKGSCVQQIDNLLS